MLQRARINSEFYTYLIQFNCPFSAQIHLIFRLKLRLCRTSRIAVIQIFRVEILLIFKIFFPVFLRGNGFVEHRCIVVLFIIVCQLFVTEINMFAPNGLITFIQLYAVQIAPDVMRFFFIITVRQVSTEIKLIFFICLVLRYCLTKYQPKPAQKQQLSPSKEQLLLCKIFLIFSCFYLTKSLRNHSRPIAPYSEMQPRYFHQQRAPRYSTHPP